MFNEFTIYDFYYASGFWLDQFIEIIDAMELILDKIINRKHGICCENKVSFFHLFRKWHKPDTYEDFKSVCRRQRTWYMCMCYALFYLLKENYETCVLAIDYSRLTPALFRE